MAKYSVWRDRCPVHEPLKSQRKGPGVASTVPLYVLGKIAHDDTFIVEKRGGLDSTELVSRDVNWVSGEVPAELFRAKVKIHYTTKEVEARVMSVGEDQVKVQLDEPTNPGSIYHPAGSC